MKVFLVGATGRTGRWILAAALAHGHEVTALVRGDPGRIPISHARLSVENGDLLDLPALPRLLAGHGAILSALNSQVVEAGTERLIAAAAAAGVGRFVGVAGGGILQLDETRLRRDRPGYPAAFFRSSEGHLRAWKALDRSALDWTLVCTPDLADAPASGLAKAREEFMPEGGRSVPCGDVAEFMVGELNAPLYSRKRIGFTV